MIKILFICHGNICRSPMAEFILKDMISRRTSSATDLPHPHRKYSSQEFEIASAATSTEEIWNGIGNPVYPPARKELARHGIGCEGKRAVQMKAADYHYYNYLIGMDDANIRNMRRIAGGDPEHKIYKLLEFAGSSRDIADPWYTGNFDITYRDITEGCEAFLDMLEKDGRI